ncbi:MAG: hypothetical protein DRN04_07715 [Thermoprotei archaeon]|nr:MAG: hypothetical protein DRN04_07715 [Thermoprotei archaeon]
MSGTIASVLIGLVYYSPTVYFISRKRLRRFGKRNVMKIDLTTLSILAECIVAQLVGLSVMATSACVPMVNSFNCVPSYNSNR